MINLGKNDSQESQGSYKAKNSKEIKHLKNEVKRLRAENSSLKTINQTKNDKPCNKDECVTLLMLSLMYTLLLVGTLWFKNMQIEGYKEAYQQCEVSKALNPAAVNSSETISHVSETEFESQVSKYITTDDIALHSFEKVESHKAVNKLAQIQKEEVDSVIQYIKDGVYNTVVFLLSSPIPDPREFMQSPNKQ